MVELYAITKIKLEARDQKSQILYFLSPSFWLATTIHSHLFCILIHLFITVTLLVPSSYSFTTADTFFSSLKILKTRTGSCACTCRPHTCKACLKRATDRHPWWTPGTAPEPGNWSQGRFSLPGYPLVVILKTMNIYYPVNIQLSVCVWGGGQMKCRNYLIEHNHFSKKQA